MIYSERAAWLAVVAGVLGCSSGSSSGSPTDAGAGSGGTFNTGGSTSGGTGGAAGGSGGGGSGGVNAEQVRAAAIRLSTCDGSRIGYGYDLWHRFFASTESSDWVARVACMMAASDCAGVLACDGYDATKPCDSATYTPACDGKTMVQCDFGFVQKKSCGTLNSCAPDPIDGVTCTSGSCATTGESCAGNIATRCYSGVERKQDCGEDKLTCVAASDGTEAACVQAGTTCSASHCEGTKYVTCLVQMIRSVSDCSWFGAGYGCVDTSANPAFDGVECQSAQPDCLGSEGATECQGKTARRCIGGRWWDFDCSTFLNGSCALTTSGEARCKSPAWK